MSRGMGVVQYSTLEGGSGYVANPSLPWLSTYNVTQQSPVYDQGPGWLRDSQPGSFTYYPRFGPPYSYDGGVLPPYREDVSQPVPVNGTLLRSDVVAPMPSITSTAREGCQSVDGSGTSFTEVATQLAADVAETIEENPWLAALIGLVAGALLFGGRDNKK